MQYNVEQYRYKFFVDKKKRLFLCIDTGIDFKTEDKPEIVTIRELETEKISDVPAKEFVGYITEKTLVETEVRAK